MCCIQLTFSRDFWSDALNVLDVIVFNFIGKEKERDYLKVEIESASGCFWASYIDKLKCEGPWGYMT